LSTSSRLACALVALGIVAPIGAAVADTGGTPYGTTSSNKKPAAKAQTAPSPQQFAPLGNRLPLREGMHGKDVRILQRLINDIGIRLSTDGQYGHQTWAAIRRIEKRAGRPVNGVLDADDLSALSQFVNSGGASGFTPGSAPTQPAELPAGSRARVAANGLAAAPADAPDVVKAIIAAGNRIASKPYVYGGGHGHWQDRGYDCSGSVSYALHFAGLLKVSRDSTGFEHYGAKGPGQWVTIYANGGHAWMIVAGLRFDTSGATSAGSRWQSAKRSTGGYVVRHPVGL
jgi:peptidoglycan hydrolase-like protein with peptidoglycan-binding domain